MRHRKANKKLGRDYKHRRSILRNLMLNLIKRERIQTTKKKAKLLRSYIEKIITRAKVDNLHNRRLVYKEVRDTKALKKLFDKIAPRFKSRNGGYTRIYLLGVRKGDAAETALIEFLDGDVTQVEAKNEEKIAKTKKSSKTEEKVVDTEDLSEKKEK